MRKILVIIKEINLLSVSSVKNALSILNSLSNVKTTILVIVKDKISENSEALIKTIGFNLEIFAIDPYKNYKNKISKFSRFFILSISYLMKSKKNQAKSQFDDIIVVGDAAWQAPTLKLSQFINDKVRLFYWMLELPIKFTGYFNIFVRFFISKIENRVIKCSQILIIPNLERKEFLVKKYPELMKKTVNVVKNYPMLKMLSQNTDIGELSIIEGKKYFCFTGYISEFTTGLTKLIPLFKNIFERFNVIFVFAGPINRSFYEAQFKTGENKFIQYIGNVDKLQTQSIQKHSLAGMAFYYGKTINHKLCAPQKVFEYLNFNVPVLCSNNQPLINLIDKNNLGHTIDINNFNESIFRITELIEKFDIIKENIHLWKVKNMTESSIQEEIRAALLIEDNKFQGEN